MTRNGLWAILALLACGCASTVAEETPAPPMRACTRIGCSSGLSVEVNSAVQQPLVVTVRSGSQVIHTFRCEAGQPCRGFAENQTPSQVTVSVQAAAGEVSKSFTPEYVIRQPNGPDCPPDCRQAVVTVAVS